MRIAIITDEISNDPVTACELARDWGLRHVEVRQWYRCRAPEGMTDADIEELRRIGEDHGLDFPSISPGLFKLHAGDPRVAQHRGELQTRSLELAEGLGAGIVIAFSYIREEGQGFEDWPPEMVDDLRALGDAAAQRGVRVAVENEPICFAPTGETMAKLVAEIADPNIGVNWDPGNQLWTNGTSWDTGYPYVRDQMIHCHVKERLLGDGEPPGVGVAPGQGDVGWPAQLRAMREDGYDGFVVVETHFTPKVARSRQSVQALRSLLQDISEAAQ